MRETSFIKQNKKKWKEFEQILEQKEKDPDKLNDLFIQVTDDLSYSRTFYPNRSVRVYLNNLAQQIFYSIYKSKRSRVGRLSSFWTEELPRLVHESRSEFRLSFLIFFSAFAIGWFSSYMDPEFPRAILGDSYVDMTIENIESGDPMAVYKQRGEFGMSLGITGNNLFVAFLTFVLGVFFAVGSIGIMISNGVMVGAFQFFFFEKGLFVESFLTIWIHGTLEISAIIIAGAAGLTMGRGLVFPGTLTRLQSFQISARRGMKIMVGITPIIIMAGFIEGYLTRYTGTPDIVRFLFIMICLVFVLGYFVVLPMIKARKGFKRSIRDTKIPPDVNQVIDFTRVKTTGEVFTDVFIAFRKYLSPISLVALLAGVLFCIAVFPFVEEEASDLYYFPAEIFGSLKVLKTFFLHDKISFLPFVNVVVYTFVAFVSFTLIKKEAEDELGIASQGNSWSFYLVNLIKMLFGMGVWYLILLTNDWYTNILFLTVSPIIFLWMYVMYAENIDPLNGISRTFALLQSNYGRALGVFFILACVGVLFFSIMDTTVLWFYFEMIGWNMSMEQDRMDNFLVILFAFTSVFVLSMILPLVFKSTGLLYYTLLEIKEAPSLREKIKTIGLNRKIQGLDREI